MTCPHNTTIREGIWPERYQRCCICKLPIGYTPDDGIDFVGRPANITPDVAIEIRAAGLASHDADNLDAWGTNGAQMGWWLHLDEEQGEDHYSEAYMAYYAEWPSGWLAREIATHGVTP